MSDIAAELPLQVILELMGVPVEDRHLIFDWSNRMIGFDDPDYQTSPEDGRAAATDMFMYANKLAVDRKRSPQADVISTLMRAELDGEALTETEFDAFFVLLSVAGNETTRNLISGGMLALLEHPEQRDKLLDNPIAHPDGHRRDAALGDAGHLLPKDGHATTRRSAARRYARARKS